MPLIGENGKPIEVLLVEDSPGDVRLTQEAFRDANTNIHLYIASDGVEAIEFLQQTGAHSEAVRPDLILLDLNLPKMDGREVLAHIKDDDSLKTIPTVILTTSELEVDILKSYKLQANAYLTKPVLLVEFEGLVKSINDFWLTRARLPQKKEEHMSASERVSHPVVRILLVEDSPGDVRLTREAFRDANPNVRMEVANDGVEAMEYLRKNAADVNAPPPDLILLDLNMPRMDGRQVLAEIKGSDDLKSIPTIILTTSGAEADILQSYTLQANAYVTKPVQLDDFEDLVRSINDFWLTRVTLPHKLDG